MQTKNWHILARTRPNLNYGIRLQKSYVTELDMRGLACNFCLFFSKICCKIDVYVANQISSIEKKIRFLQAKYESKKT